MRKTLIAIAAAGMIAAGCSSTVDQAPAIPVDKAVEAKVEKVLKKMTLEEKAGQMVQMNISTVITEGKVDEAKLEEMFRHYKIGSILNTLNDHSYTREETADFVSLIQRKSMEILGTPCIYGMDMIHGASYLTDGTLFPQEINIAATFDRTFAADMGRIMAYESRAAQVPWVFSPVMDLGRDPRWPRHWESFGEDPYLQAEMARTETVAIQGEDPNHVDLEHAAVSLKHFMAYGVPHSGKDRTPAYVAENDLREKFFRPFKDCFLAGGLTAMINSASINGVPTHANHTLLTVWVKEQLGWDGLMVTDWADINNLFQRDHVAADRREAVKIGINAGIDMIMDPYDPTVTEDIIALVRSGEIPMFRVDDAVRRILRTKVRLGLFDNPVWEHDYADFGSEAFVERSYRAAVESEVLLKNEGGLLPLKGTERILVTGPNANTLRAQNGGWSYTWQGAADAFVPQFNTFKEALEGRFPKVTYVPGVEYDPMIWSQDHDTGIAKAVAAARGVDVVIAFVGENSYCETVGNMDDLNLSDNQKALVKALAATGKPLVLVLNEGRPRIIGDIEPLAQAVVDVMLPSNYGSDALAALLSGDENFSGKLPFTYSRKINSLHTYDYKVSEHRETMGGLYNYDAVMDVQWPFGHGLSYTTFAYSNLTVDKGAFRSGDVLKVSVNVTNTGDRAGKEAVLLYSSDLVASLIPDVKRLRGFDKVELAPGETKTVTFSLPADELAFVGEDGAWRLEEGDFRISCGGLGVMTRCTATRIWETPNIR